MHNNYNLVNDIYYSDDYISLYLEDGQSLFSFEYREESEVFINKAIKRPIKQIGSKVIVDGYYDLETAYGYGGFYSNSNNSSFIDRAFKLYLEKCKDENIIAEFIRFHPFNTFPREQSNHLDFNFYDRDTVVIPLNRNILDSYTSKVRNIIKRANEKVTVRESSNLENFIKLYHETMKKNEAMAFYFFDTTLFTNLYNLENVKLYEVVLEDEIVAMGFFIEGKEFLHYHLSANSNASYKVNANYALLYKLSEIAKLKGKDYLILGGGTTSLIDDSLLKFKKKFSKETKPFYISGKIYNQEIYENYVTLWEEQSKEDIKYFLKYRLEIK